MNRFNLTRYAPTPSGYLHFGNLYSFVLTYHLAQDRGAKILLRIDDLDKERVKPKYIQDIFDTLDYLEIPYDLGPTSITSFKNEYSQHKRMDLYHAALTDLQANGHLFACDCSRSKILKANAQGIYTGYCRDRKLAFNQPGCSWRMRTTHMEPVTIRTLHQGTIQAAMPALLTDAVLRKKDGMPAYQLASVVDDLHFGVDLVVRGKDLWGSSLLQLSIAQKLQKPVFNQVVFHHHPLLLGPDKQKLSKSAGDTSILHFRQAGKPKSAVYQHLAALLGYREKAESLIDFGFFIKKISQNQ